MSHSQQPDAVIIGGGIAGLWMLRTLRSKGYDVLLLEKDRLGGTQTMASQGVLHGGLKYALNGKLTDSSEAIRDMPARWKACFSGGGEVDLSAVQHRSSHQVLWSEGGLSSRLTTFFGSKALAGRSKKLLKADAPDVLRNDAYKGALYRLEEPVIDVPSLIRALAEPCMDAIYSADNVIISDGVITLPNGQTLQPGRIILAAGQGNEAFCDQQPMQRRPLHQVMVAKSHLPPFYSVCMGAGTKPVLVTTSHEAADGSPVWYLGGNLAETGVDRSEADQIAFAQGEMERLLPWLDLSDARWGTVRVDRAEPRQVDGEKPAGAFCRAFGSTILTWPTKLVMAPLLGDEVLRLLPPLSEQSAVNLDLPHPTFAETPWSNL
jgi:glycerol-3-phosphate dehydrogenase